MRSLLRSLRCQGVRLASVTMLALVASCDSPSGPTPAGPPAHLEIVSGDAQTAVVGTALPAPLVVHVTDDKGKDVQGQVVNFRVTGGNGTVFAGTALTDKDGRAQERWTLGTVARDTQKVEARAVDASTGNPIVFATFRAVATPDAPAELTKLSGDAQTAPVGSAVPDSLAVRLADRYGNSIPAQTIAWSVPAGGGSVSPASGVTDTAGVARARWTLGARLDSAQAAAASFGSLPAVSFTATATVTGTLAKVGGDNQSGTVANRLGDSLTVRLTTAGGQPVRGAFIQWSPSSGSTVPAISTTGADGIARTAWYLGNASGPQTATAMIGGIGGGAQVSFAATALPDAPTVIGVLGGNGQAALAGSALPDSVAAIVYDRYHNPVAGALVRWRARSGAGQLSPDSSVTRADGTARSAWTLGSTGGTVYADAILAAAPDTATFTATVRTSLVVSIISAVAQGDSVPVIASVTSRLALVSVVASVGGRQAPLTFSGGRWYGTVPLAGLPRDTMTLTVTATDTIGTRATSMPVVILHDLRPSISVTSPLQDAVVRNDTVHVVASCTDDDPAGCASISVQILAAGGASPLLATGTGSIDAYLPVGAYEGQPITLHISAADSRRQTVTKDVGVTVNASGHLNQVAQVPGTVWDVAPDRILYLDSAGVLKVRNRSTGAESTVPSPGGSYTGGRLGPSSVVFISRSGTVSSLYEWKGGAPVALGAIPSPSLVVKGGWAIWNTVAPGGKTLVRRNLGTGVNDTISTNAGNVENDLAENGDVVYWDAGYSVHRWHAGADSVLAVGSGTVWNAYPTTDGSLVAFRRSTPCCSSQTFQVVLFDPAHGETVLAGPSPNDVQWPEDYTLLAGWLAFTRAGTGGQPEVWRRAPGGSVEKLSGFGTRSWVEAVGADGSVSWRNGSRRYLSVPGSAPIDLGAGVNGDRVVWQGGKLVLMHAGYVFEIVP